MDDLVDGLSEVSCDVLVIGGGTAGPMAALKAKLKNPNATVILLEKANVKRSGAISMGMDGLNNAVIPGYATPEQYTKEITIANDGIVDQKPVYKYAQRCYSIIEELDSFGIRFLKNENGDFAVKKVHHIGTYVLPMPNGETVKKALYRQLRRARLLISNRYMATRLLDRKRRPHRRRHRGEHPHRRIPGASRPRPSSSAWAPPAGSACRPPATCSAPTRTRPIPATATPWPITPARRSRTSNASRSIR